MKARISELLKKLKMSERTKTILNWTCRVLLAAMFFYTGYIKLPESFSWKYNLQFAITLTGYELLPENPEWVIPFIAQWFPWVEIALGVFLLIGWKMRYVAAAATSLLLFFTVLLTITYLRGIDANCGCFDFNSKITPLTILRDSIILIPALYLLFERRSPAKYEIPETPKNSSENGESAVS